MLSRTRQRVSELARVVERSTRLELLPDPSDVLALPLGTSPPQDVADALAILGA